jgi:hypothetical protein
VRFGRENTLDLRSSLPTALEAERRAEAFLRERQVAGVAEVLVVTGRGNQSSGGVAIVRPAVESVLARLRRKGVVAGWQEHTPGSFVVTPAAIGALFDAPPRHGDRAEPPVADSGVFDGLHPDTRAALRALAVRSLQGLGVPTDDRFVLDEMQRQFSALGKSIAPGVHAESQLRATAIRALDEMDDTE